MSQLKQDEWPADNEPTTTEAQVPPANARQERARGGPGPRPSPGDASGPGADASTADELRNVSPDEQID